MTKDIRQGYLKRKYDYQTGIVGREYFIAIDASEVQINLKEHQLQSETPGWSGIDDSNNSHSKRQKLSRVRVTNGTIDVQANGIGARLPRRQPVASLWHDFNAEPLLRQPHETRGDPLEIPQTVRKQLGYVKDYSGSAYHFENLTILAGTYGLKLAGRGNIIRGNRIEVTDSKSAIYLFGPDNIIEDNIIIFRGEAVTMTAAPIKLHLGDRTIIRNNLFIVETDEKAPKHVVSLIESADVEFSGNRVFGVSRLTRAFDSLSNAALSTNQSQALENKPELPDKVRKASMVR